MTACPIDAIAVKDLSKRYLLKSDAPGAPEEIWALKNVSFEVKRSQIVGIIGRNGAGKTTLMNIIAGSLSASEGVVSTAGVVRGLFQLGVGFQDELTGRENIFLNGAIIGVSRQELVRQLNAIIEFSELGECIDLPLGSYSQGMRLRLAFSIIANTAFDLLVIDEVLAVGDSLFRDKCLKRLTDFRHQARTLVISTQDLDLIERLCDEVILLDHGAIVSKGSPHETVQRYRGLLATERFYIGPCDRPGALVTQTKRWSEDKQAWGKTLGTKEVAIDSVRFYGSWKVPVGPVMSRGRLSVRVGFTASREIPEPHFGVAFFRQDGVYCYGPNTGFDGYYIPRLKKGKGSFQITFERFLLAPGAYRCSVAIWDKHETVAYDYHAGFYAFTVSGKKSEGEPLVSMPYAMRTEAAAPSGDLAGLFALFDRTGNPAERFLTHDALILRVYAERIPVRTARWLGLFTSEGVLCQGFVIPAGRHDVVVELGELLLLPGGYELRLCSASQEIIYENKSFTVACACRDHGIIRLKHRWKWGMSAHD